ncbi:M24 family metallopeptidase [Maledivibacter halophilus]|uniref:Xaa-Pro dipeptidase n=1 Tax=Maledivibacter halophilus TaxID=36842 RepID=A0A1T5MJ40_9FIRM|nr:Xaa-Pro peptidase family protein [Maledivibacter halophilus]SKC88232.1 Xaa-Pro dipeptidase [Maledivibacter halophilus]
MANKRFEKILRNMEKHNMDQMLITSTSSIFYLTGKWIEPGERLLALYMNTQGIKKLYINELFPINEKLDVDKIVYNDSEDPIKMLSKDVEEKGTMGIDKQWPSHFLIRLMNIKDGLNFTNGSPVIDEVRMIKDEEEINLMREASNINDKAMSDLVKTISSEYNEKKVGKILDGIYEKYGTPSFSFSPLIAYGPNAAEPHHSSDNTPLKKGDSVILDIGGKTNYYSSDMTRTVFYKEASEKQREIYKIVLEANLKGIDAVKPGVKFSDIDNAARGVIEKAGYSKYFTHRTGHNIGIDVHEFPDVSKVNDMIVKPGMTFSVEPGIYLTGEFGVRIEDLVLVTENGCEVLNKYTKEMQII